MNNFNYSSIESDRFKYNIHRGKLTEINCDEILNYINENNVDVLICRLPVALQPELYKLNRHKINYLVADTLVYYKHKFDIVKSLYKYVNDDLKYRIASESDQNLIIDLMNSIFENYKNHYSSNPKFKEEDIRAGYLEWALSHIDSPNKMVFIPELNHIPIGFLCCSEGEDYGDVILTGILDEYTGKGYFGRLLKHSMNYCFLRGKKHMMYSTQIQNLAAQKSILKEGFVIDHAYITLHIMKNN